MSDKNNESQFHFLIIGALIVIIIILAGGKLHEIDFFGILKFRIPTETPSSSTNSLVPTESENRIQASEVQSSEAVVYSTETIPLPPTPCIPTFPNGAPITNESLANIVGGEARYWTTNGNVVWTYSHKNVNATFLHPGGDFVLTYWAGFSQPRNSQGCTIEKIMYNDSATYSLKCPTSGAEFEADGVGLHPKLSCIP